MEIMQKHIKIKAKIQKVLVLFHIFKLLVKDEHF